MCSINEIEYVDIVCGLAWGDEAKGKIVADLVKNNSYDWVCRWNGGSNAGHTVYVNNKKYNTNIIPSGIFYDIPCYIGPDCYVNIDDLEKEMLYLKNSGFNINLIRISPKAHLIQNKHKQIDEGFHNVKQGSTKRGIAPCGADKFGRTGIRVESLIDTELITYKVFNPSVHIMKSNEYILGKILCEGAQGFWLDINHGSYPYVTSSYTLPYSACSLGFLPQQIRHIYGAAKIYDTRVGVDPFFEETITNNEDSHILAISGDEFGTTTGRLRKTNWLNLKKLMTAVQISGCTHLVISKVDILEKMNVFKTLNNTFTSMKEMQEFITNELLVNCKYLKKIIYSSNPYSL